MIRSALLVLLACAVAIVGGAASLAYMLDAKRDIGAVTVGPWRTFPEAGTETADPYHKARYAMDGVLSLGAAEGRVFFAETDSRGERLTAACAYVLSGPMPAARFWTIRGETDDGGAWRAGPAIHSRNLLRKPDNSVELTAGAKPAPGNWLPVAADGAFRLVLTLYDSATTTTQETTDAQAPAIERHSCDG